MVVREVSSRDAATTARTPRDEAEIRALMSAAYKLLGDADPGIGGIQAILDEAGLARRAFYRHFASKDDLVIAMYRRENVKVAAALTSAMADAADPPSAVDAWIDHWMAIIFEPGRFRHVRALRSSDPLSVAGIRTAAVESYEFAIAALAGALADGRSRGDFPTVDPLPDARFLHAAAIGILEDRLFRADVAPMSDHRERLRRLVARLGNAPLDVALSLPLAQQGQLAQPLAQRRANEG